MQLTINIPDRQPPCCKSRGVGIAALLVETVAREAQSVSRQTAQGATAAAVDSILERRSRLTLDHLKSATSSTKVASTTPTD